jgi:2-hydroxy-6-oxonona-2,4-dienedioate hydrolase
VAGSGDVEDRPRLPADSLDGLLYRGAPERLSCRFRFVEGRRVYERFGGAGATVVFVHGIGVSGRYLLPTAARLLPDHRVLVPDLPGFGRSGRLGRRPTVAALSGALVAWLGAVGVDHVDALVANSFGCQLALEVAATRPERVAQLVLVGPTVDPGARTLREQAAKLAVDAAREPLQLDLLQAFDYCIHVRKSGLAGFGEMVRDRPEDRLAAVEAPTLVVRGERDPIVPRAWAELVARGVQRGRLVEVPASGHAVNYAAPDALARLVREQLADDRSGLRP